MDCEVIELVDTESLVPQGHLLRKVDGAVDFGKLYEIVDSLYSEDDGRPSIAPVVDRVRKAVRHLEHEAELLRGFVRFSELEGALVGEISPKNRVLPLLRPHFCARFPQETFLLHDATHREVLLHRPGRWTILPVEDFRMGPPGEEELAWRGLWRSFYHTISIRERYNPKCRMTHMPKRYWGYMTEFQEDGPLTPVLRTAPDGRRPAPAGDSPGG